jgi:AmpE protein
MEFLAVLFSAFMLQRPELAKVHKDDWLDWLLQRCKALPLPGVVAPVLALMLPSLLCHYLFAQVQGGWFGLLELGFLLLLLAYCVGRDQRNSHEEYFRTVRHDDEQAAYNRAGEWIDNASYESFNELHLAVERDFLWQRVDRWFGMVFWFIALGPIGALAYRLLQLLAEREESLAELSHLSRWLPSRLTAISFAIVGNFDAVVNRWSTHSAGSDDDFLWRQACAALGLSVQIERHDEVAQREGLLKSLLHRSLVLWVALIALVSILV